MRKFFNFLIKKIEAKNEKNFLLKKFPSFPSPIFNFVSRRSKVIRTTLLQPINKSPRRVRIPSLWTANKIFPPSIPGV